MLDFVPLRSAPDAELDFLFDDLDRTWQEAGRPGSLRAQLESRKSALRTGALRGLLAREADRKPVAFGWIDLPHGAYGNLLLHAPQVPHRGPLAAALVRSGFLRGCVLELVHFHEGEEFRQMLRVLGQREHRRQKMACALEAEPSFPPAPAPLSFEPLSLDEISISGALSHAAHAVSRDLEGYPDFASPERRAALERRLLEGLYGPLVAAGSLLLREQGVPAGASLLVEMSGWGLPRVGWLLDLVIDPPRQGRGLGRALLQQVLQGARQAGLPVVGLAVTLTNEPALRLYEQAGFRAVESFYEYIGL